MIHHAHIILFIFIETVRTLDFDLARTDSAACGALISPAMRKGFKAINYSTFRHCLTFDASIIANAN